VPLLEVVLHQRVVDLGLVLLDHVVVLRRVGALVVRDVVHLGELAAAVVRVGHRHDRVPERVAQFRDYALEAGVVVIEVRDDDRSPGARRTGRVPQLPGMERQRVARVDDEHDRLDDVDRGDRLGHEVGVARGVEEVALHRAHRNPEQVRRQGLLALLLLRLAVADARAIGDAAEARGQLLVMGKGVDQRGLAGVSVADDSQVTDVAAADVLLGHVSLRRLDAAGRNAIRAEGAVIQGPRHRGRPDRGRATGAPGSAPPYTPTARREKPGAATRCGPSRPFTWRRRRRSRRAGCAP
jgi:hypothetical protein